MQLLEISVLGVASLGTIVLAIGRRPAFASLRAKWLGRQHYAHPIPTLVFAALVLYAVGLVSSYQEAYLLAGVVGVAGIVCAWFVRSAARGQPRAVDRWLPEPIATR